MKFPQLPVGQYFRWQGERYCKAGPMTAHASDGSQRLIPHSARVEPLDAAADMARAQEGGTEIPAADVAAALAAFTGSLRDHAAGLEGPARSALAERIDAAERDFRRALSLPGRA